MRLVRSPNLCSWILQTASISLTLRTLFTCNSQKISKKMVQNMPVNCRFCSCCPRRHFLGAVSGIGFLPLIPSFAIYEDAIPQYSTAMLHRIHPPTPVYATAMDSYEAEFAGYASPLFANLRGKEEKILEIGIGTGPNLEYYADNPGIHVIGIDPDRKMEKFARAAAETAGLPPSNFRFMQAVAEALPLNDASVDAVVGTLVLCSVKDVDQALQEVRRVLKPGGIYIFVEHVAAKEGTILRLVQGILDPLRQHLADGCRLTRNTATNIARAGFAKIDVNLARFSSTWLMGPHVYGIAYK